MNRSSFTIKTTALLSALLATALLVGCVSGGTETTTIEEDTPADAGVALAAQSGERSVLFYGNTNHRKLGSTTNVKVFEPLMPDDVLVSKDIMWVNIGKPYPGTTLLGYSSSDHSYTDLYVDSLYYVTDSGSPKRVSMKSWHDMETHTDNGGEELAHSSATGLTSPSYVEVNYLGTKRFLLATDGNDQKVLVCPTASGTETAIPFVDKTFLTVWYASYGEMASAAVIYDSVARQFQKMVPPTEACAACNDPGTELSYTNFTGLTMAAESTYKFLGDIGGTDTSALIVDGKLYMMDKSELTITEVTVTSSGTAVTLADLLSSTGKAAYKFSGDSIYYFYTSGDPLIGNIYRVNITTGALTQLTSGYGNILGDNAPNGIKAFTDDWVIYGSDNVLMAVEKSAMTATPTVLKENTKTSGVRYPFNFGIGGQYLYVTYSVDTTTGKTTYQACMFDAEGVSACNDDSFWVGVSAARQGKLNFTSSYPYTPYAFVRIDSTDNFGGGTIKAVDPTKPLDAGFAVGSVPNYNFNTFLHAYYYLNTTVDSDGYIVIYGKRDDNFIGDAFLINLRQANSVRNLTNEAAPSAALINSGAAHCHGRYCSVCHNFAGGKIYGDVIGSVAAPGYNVKLEFEDSSSVLARLGKGLGENFSVLHSDIKGEFTPVLVSASDSTTEIKRGDRLGHAGLSYSNCDYCHSRSGDVLRYNAPGPITTVDLP